MGTTVRDAPQIPVNLVADEKHSWRLGECIYIPTTVATGCILGVDVVESADTQALVKGYERFRAEARSLNPDYQPETVNTDGWEHTQTASRTLFPNIQIVLCFLPVILDIHFSLPPHQSFISKADGQTLAYLPSCEQAAIRESACVD